jgi:hypothetical protein
MIYFKIKFAFIKWTLISRHLKNNSVEEILMKKALNKYMQTYLVKKYIFIYC